MSSSIIIVILFLSVAGSLVPAYSSSAYWSSGSKKKNHKKYESLAGKALKVFTKFNNCSQTSVSGGLSLTLTR